MLEWNDADKMAENCSNLVENDGKAPAEGAENIAVDETDLDALLDDALKDFSKDEILYPAAKVKGDSNDKKDDSASACKSKEDCVDELLKENLDEMFSDESISKFAEEFSKALQNMPEGDIESLKDFEKQRSNLANDSDSSQKEELHKYLEDNLEQAWASMAQNLKDMKDENHEDEMDKDFIQAMKGLGLDDLDANPEGFLSLMQGMMTNLLSKDILYPSLKEIQTKYPAWLEEQKSVLSKSDYERFARQQDLVSRICCEFESEKETDSEEVKGKRVGNIMELMQKMQACGQPPFDLLGQTVDEIGDEPSNSRPEMQNPEQCTVM